MHNLSGRNERKGDEAGAEDEDENEEEEERCRDEGDELSRVKSSRVGLSWATRFGHGSRRNHTFRSVGPRTLLEGVAPCGLSRRFAEL